MFYTHNEIAFFSDMGYGGENKRLPDPRAIKGEYYRLSQENPVDSLDEVEVTPWSTTRHQDFRKITFMNGTKRIVVWEKLVDVRRQT